MIEKIEEPGMLLRICDECGDSKKIKYDSWRIGKIYRKRDKDLCIACGTKKSHVDKPRSIGNEAPQWRGGKSKGYQLAYWRNLEDGIVQCGFEHRLVMSRHIGRRLTKQEVIHHIDLDKLNNDISNLYLCENEKLHQYIHASMELCGFKLFGKLIWFDYDLGSYSIEKKISPESSILPLDEYGTIGIHRIGKNRYAYSNKYRRLLHVVLAEQMLDRKLFKNEVVHHIDGDSLNNDLSNLKVMSISSHMKSHRSLQNCVAKLYESGVVEFDREKGIYIESQSFRPVVGCEIFRAR